MKGPKTLLAEAIAQALAEYFEVDPNMIESSLLRDAKIVLSDTRLRPQTVQVARNERQILNSWTTGVVDQVAFTWAWSIGSESLVKDATLTIRGLKFKTRLSYTEVGEQDERKLKLQQQHEQQESHSNLEEIKKEGRVAAYIRNQVEQIIEALTLVVTDFEFSLELPPDGGQVSGVSVGGQSVELKSLGRQLCEDDEQKSDNAKGSLQQQLSFGSFCINITKSMESETQTLPLLAPLSYRATATRYAGARFSGMNVGLKVVGLPMPSMSMRNIKEDIGICFHAGTDQIQVLTQLGNLILKSAAAAATSLDSETETEEFQDAIEEENEANGENGIVAPSAQDDEFGALKNDEMTSSIFRLPISGISLVLPNETKMTLEAFTVNYKADGSEMNIEGAYGAGILVDEYQLVETNNGCDNAKSRWLIDFISSTFSIVEDHDESKRGREDFSARVARIQCRRDIAKRVVEGMMDMLEAATDLDTAGLKSEDDASAPPPTKGSPGWTIAIEKCIELRLEGITDDLKEDADFVSMSIDSPSVKVPLGRSSELRWKRLVLGPCSQGELSVSIPASRQLPDSDTLCVDGTITAIMQSPAVAQASKDFLNDFAEAAASLKVPGEEEYAGAQGIAGEDSSPVDTSEADTPIGTAEKNSKGLATVSSSENAFSGFKVTMPKVNFTVLAPNAQAVFEDIEVSSTEVEVKSVNLEEESGNLASLSGIRATFTPQMELHVGTLGTLYVSKTFHLLQPVRDATLGFEDETLCIKLKSIHGMLLSDDEDESDTEQSSRSSRAPSIPFPIKLSLEELLLKKEDDRMLKKTTSPTKSLKKEKEKDQQTFLQLRQLEVDVRPAGSSLTTFDESDEDEQTHVGLSVPVKVRVGKLNNQLVHLQDANLSASLYLDRPTEEVGNFRFETTKPIRVQAGFSAVDWKGMFLPRKKNVEKEEPIRLPSAFIGPLKLQVSYDFKLVAGKPTSVEISAFTGTSSTTTDALIKYYSEKVKKYAPDFMYNTEVLGANVKDTGLATYGTYALQQASPYGGAAVGVIGVAGVDAVLGALQAGKKSRGVARDEGYKPGDFARGIMYSIGQASKDGAAKRRQSHHGEEEDGQFANFVIGAGAGAVGYVDLNKARLGGAGAAGVGMVVGSILGGPIGGIAGGVLAGATTTKTIQVLEKKFDKRNSDEEEAENIEKEAGDESAPLDKAQVERLLQKPQGLLYKQRDTFQSQWRPRWFILNMETKVLTYHYISSNEPPLIDTKKPMFGWGEKKTQKKDDFEPPAGGMGFQPVAEATTKLAGCKVQVEDKLSDPEKHLFAFSITPPKSGRTWHLAATSKEARFMWVGMLAELTGLVQDIETLVETCREVDIDAFAETCGLEDSALFQESEQDG